MHNTQFPEALGQYEVQSIVRTPLWRRSWELSSLFLRFHMHPIFRQSPNPPTSPPSWEGREHSVKTWTKTGLSQTTVCRNAWKNAFIHKEDVPNSHITIIATLNGLGQCRTIKLWPLALRVRAEVSLSHALAQEALLPRKGWILVILTVSFLPEIIWKMNEVAYFQLHSRNYISCGRGSEFPIWWKQRRFTESQ